MVMIPTDVGIQVRNQTDPGTHPVRAIADLPSDLPELLPGQTFRARIQEVLPENSYKAVVAGRLLTLSLPEGAKAGDTLELVVVSQGSQSILARRSDAGAAAAAPFENSSLSRTGQLIASLLGSADEKPAPAKLGLDGPVLARVPANGAEVARELPLGLAKAIGVSGVFYEAHQVQWLLGQRAVASLLAEPQGRLSGRAGLPSGAGQESALVTRRDGGPSAADMGRLQEAPARESLPPGLSDADALPVPVRTPLAIPEELRQLVQQQLEAGATNRLAWSGEVWPDQTMDWEIHRDHEYGTALSEPRDVWQTRMRIDLPRLGTVDARLQLAGGSMSLVVEAVSEQSEVLLEAALPALRNSFAAAGINLVGAQVKHEAG